MPKRRTPSMNIEMLEYLKFLHIHNLVDIIAIIESIPIYYQTQIKKFTTSKKNIENITLQKMRLQNITYIARHCFNFSFPNFKFNFQTYRLGPFSLDIENELQNLINSEVFNNAVSSKKQMATKRYMITNYDKQQIIDMFKGAGNYRDFLGVVEDKDIFSLRDISLALEFHNHVYSGKMNGQARNDMHKEKILLASLRGVVSWKKDYNAYIKELVDFISSLRKSQSLQSLSS